MSTESMYAKLFRKSYACKGRRRSLSVVGLVFGLVLSSFLLSLSCKKDALEKEPEFDRVVTCKVVLDSLGKVHSWELCPADVAETFLYVVKYQGDTVSVIHCDTLFQMVVLDSDGLITMILDSMGNQFDTLYYTHYNQDQYLSNLIRVNPFFDLSYHYDSSYSRYSTGINVDVTLTEIASVVDFVVNPPVYYMNLIHLGKQNSRLIRHIQWGANGGPSTYASESLYSYGLNAKGQVIQKTETCYPPYHVSTQLQESDIRHYLTVYEYVVQ